MSKSQNNKISYSLTQGLSDKIYWHGYIQFYEKFFHGRVLNSIAEFGVFQGNSIRWLLERFPDAKIYGADISPIKDNWPVDPRFQFIQLDQASKEQVANFLNLEKFDLIIEDGSHQPRHQINCLIEGLKALNSNGVYILEDVQTARKDHHWWNKKIRFWKLIKKAEYKKHLAQQHLDQGNALHALLAIDHYQRIQKVMTQDIIEKIAIDSMLNIQDIELLVANIKEIHLYQRNHLPDFCHQCGSADFNFSKLKCYCGVDIFSDEDSMAFVLVKR